MALPDPIDAARTARKGLLAREQKLAETMLRLYRRSERRLKARLKDLEKELTSLSPEDAPGKFFARERVQAQLRQIRTEIELLSPRAASVVESAQRVSAIAGARDAEVLAKATAVTSWNRLPTQQLEALAGFMADGTPLHERLLKEGAEAVERAREVLFDGVLNGRGASRIGRELANAVSTITRNNAVLIARTESLRAYRTAAIDSYAYNSQVVGWWRWVAVKDPRTCPACLALDGTEHPLTEQFGSHPGCRCVAVPIIEGRKMDYGPTGQEWFDSQPESRQVAILGRGKHMLYREGKIGLGDLVHRVPSKWGPTGETKSLRRLVEDGLITADDRLRVLARSAQ